MKVRWTLRAEQRLDAICRHVAVDAPSAARALEVRLLLRTRQIASFPHSGRSVPEYEQPDVRELIEGSYRPIYRVLPDRVDVLTVMHCAQLLPGDLKKL
jgi:plasmid stabilization system protein ParE